MVKLIGGFAGGAEKHRTPSGRLPPPRKKKKKKERKTIPVPIRDELKREGRPVGFIERKGKQFVISPAEARDLERIGKLKPGETLKIQAQQREAEQKAVEARPALEEAGAFEEVTPREVELSPDLKSDIPFLTPIAGAASQVAKPRSVVGIIRDNGWLPDLIPPIRTGEEAFPIPETEETLREASLRQISINAFNEDTTEAEKWGAYIETLPAVGEINRWVGGVVEAPYENALVALAEIEKIATTATNNQEKTRSGIMPAAFAMNRAREMEERIAWLEGRLKLLINQSKVLQANTDKVNLMMQAILDAKIRTDNFRTAAAFALTASLTETGRIVPTDEQMYFELKEQNE